MTIEELMKDPRVEKYAVSVRLTSAERETHINIDYGSDTATVYSAIPKHYNRFAKNGWELKRAGIYEDGSVAEAVFVCPVKCVSFRKNTVLSEEEKKRIVSRLKGSSREGAGA